MWSTPQGSRAHLLKAVETGQLSIEMWKWHLVGDDRYRAIPSVGEPDSMTHVLRGRLRVRSESSDLRGDAGESARLVSAPEYTFEAGTDVVDFLGVVTVPRSLERMCRPRA